MKPAARSFLRFPLDLVFDSPANVRVVRVLARHGGPLSASSLTDAARLTKPSVLSALRQLIDAGVVEALGSERQRLYRFREAGPLAAALDALFAAEHQLYRDLIEMLRTAAEKAGVEAAWLYGSVARGEDRAGSDIDVAIVGAFDAAGAVRDGLSDAMRPLGADVSVIAIEASDVARLEREADPWWRDLKRDAVVVMGPAPDAYAGKAPRRRRRAR